MSENERGTKNGADTKPNAEELLERVGYLRAAAFAAHDAAAALSVRALAVAREAEAADPERAAAYTYYRGEARYHRENPEVRA